MASISRSYSPKRICLRSNTSSLVEDDVDATLTPTVLPTVISETSIASATDETTVLETSDEPSTDGPRETAEQIPQISPGSSSGSAPTQTAVSVEPTPKTPGLAGLQLSTGSPDGSNAGLVASTEASEEDVNPQETSAPIRVNDEVTETTQAGNLASSTESISKTGILSRPEPSSTPEPKSDGGGTFTRTDDGPTNTVELPPVVSTGAATEGGDLSKEGPIEPPKAPAPGTDQGGGQGNSDNGPGDQRKGDNGDTAGRNDQNQEDAAPPADVSDENETGGTEPEPNTSEREKETQPAADNGEPGKGGSPGITRTGTAVLSSPTDIFSGGDDGGSTDRELAGSAGGNNGLSGPQKAGIIVGSVIGSAILFALIAFLIWYMRKRKRDRKYQYVIKTPMVEQPPTLDPIPRSARLTEAVANMFKPTTTSDMSSRVDLSRGNSQFSTDGQRRSRALSAVPIGVNGHPARNGQDTTWPSDPGSLPVYNASLMAGNTSTGPSLTNGNAVPQLSDPFADTNAIATSSRQPADPFHDSQAIPKSPRLSLLPTWDPRTARPRGSTTGSMRQTSVQPVQPGASPPIKTRPTAATPGRTNVRSDQFDLEIACPPAASIPPVPRLQRHESYTSQVSSLSNYSQSDYQNGARVSRFGEAL
ncbi:uncharacterized protein F5Z01DRAFT_667171 [Emericellopsis atlantica]|uniref:Uncharacterized protein n=1 Tax=Emericellopsis atlantica TaxID=2614577 RepID=A0A9P7ZDL5_9HYPO|nr:uncharacterized protein F5Z01DRAFT_667171 [Emericellopsis atlantica]KAG9250174.1 hypothetical protein F5Z01DRAFT_667171 [Emericellopsis atlantica]